MDAIPHETAYRSNSIIKAMNLVNVHQQKSKYDFWFAE